MRKQIIIKVKKPHKALKSDRAYSGIEKSCQFIRALHFAECCAKLARPLSSAFGQKENHRNAIKMRIFLTGVSCVGKTTIGKKLGKLLDVSFFDLDKEIESFFETSIERLQNKFLTIHSFRNEAAKALVNLLSRPESLDCVIALPPSGLMGGYLRAIKNDRGTTVAVTDKPENILARIKFYDLESRPIEKKLTSKEKKLYLGKIKKDITYFHKSYQRATLQIDISGLNADQAARKIKEAIEDLHV